MTASTVVRNGRPNMIGTDASSSISRRTKSTGNINLSILTNSFEMSNFKKRECGMRLMLTPKSDKAFFTDIGTINFNMGGVRWGGVHWSL
ncbi:hypothetical protein Tco_0196003 [Tanacetum coccineum]